MAKPPDDRLPTPASAMHASTFLKRADAQRVLRRGARVARTAIAVHAHDTGESRRVTGCGTCAASCAYVQSLPWGAQACRKSRELPAEQALQRGRPVPFLCHMGFACVAAPAVPASDTRIVLTLGPFCPAESPDSLDRDARQGLDRLEHKEHTELPFTLDDIPRVPADVPADVAQWLSETLSEQWSTAVSAAETAATTPEIEHTHHARKRRRDAPVRDAFDADYVLSILAGRASAPIRRAVMTQLHAGGAKRRLDLIRARALAAAGAIVAAAERAGTVPEPARRRLAELPRVLARVESVDGVCRAVLATLRPIRSNLRRRASTGADVFAPLDAYVQERLAQPISLSEAAAHLGMTPSTLTRHIERRHGVTFTGYIARKRVERARDMLVRTHLSVEVVAHRVGFTDGAHLRKQLQRFLGRTPSEIRDSRRVAGE